MIFFSPAKAFLIATPWADDVETQPDGAVKFECKSQYPFLFGKWSHRHSESWLLCPDYFISI